MAASSGTPPGSSASPDEFDLSAVVGPLIARWRILGGLALLSGALGYGASFLLAPQFTATATFVPETPGTRLSSGIANLASQFGLGIGSDGSHSPRFYAEVLTSREILDSLLMSRYAASTVPDAGNGTLLSTLGTGGTDFADSLERARRELRKRVSTRVDNQTNIVSVNVELHDPATAAAVGNDLIHLLNDFNTKTRQFQARERRRFIEGRVGEAEAELRQLEDELRGFYERNRSWQHAPHLVVEESRLQRQLAVRQEVVTTLRREYETARIEEVNDTPVITVIDHAAPPKRRSSPRRSVVALLGAVLGALAGGAVVTVFHRAGHRTTV